MLFIKKFFKFILIILIIALVIFSAYRYYILKKDGKLDKVFAKTETNGDEYDYKAENSRKTADKKDSLKEEKKKEEKEKEEIIENSEKFVVEEKNYEGYYNQFNFDNRLLLYEGNQTGSSVKEVFEILIEDADDPMYSKPIIVFENFDLTTNEITANNLDEYKYILNSAKNTIGNSSCTISFEYNKFKAYVNKIIITKN